MTALTARPDGHGVGAAQSASPTLVDVFGRQCEESGLSLVYHRQPVSIAGVVINNDIAPALYCGQLGPVIGRVLAFLVGCHSRRAPVALIRR